MTLPRWDCWWGGLKGTPFHRNNRRERVIEVGKNGLVDAFGNFMECFLSMNGANCRTKYIDDEKFDECLNAFIMRVCAEQDEDGRKLSFRAGFLKEQEIYKTTIWQTAHTELSERFNSEHWTFCDWMMGSLHNSDNNLVHWRDIQYMQKEFDENPAGSEELLRKIYGASKKDEGFLFDEAVRMWGNRYPLISFMFFLKDKDRFLPVRPHKFQERFKTLGISDDCLTSCEWNNYQRYLSIMEEIRTRLEESKHFSNRIALIDAHSFVWMMWLLEGANDKESVEYAEEGRIVKYYGTRYERSERNRRIAIERQGCYCSVCGFDFEKAYGELGKKYIEVHHIKPLCVYGGKAEKINPETDLVCLCSNCHSMIHRGKGAPLTVGELMKRMASL